MIDIFLLVYITPDTKINLQGISSYFLLEEMDTRKLVIHESDGRYISTNLLHVITGVATQIQFDDAISGAISKVSKMPGLDLKTTYHAVLVTDRNGGTFGYGHIWFDDTRIYNMMLGKNPDGSPRTEWIEDPDWKPKPLDFNVKGMSWADIEDLDECPKIRKDLPPLMKLDDYPYSPEQVDLLMKHPEFEVAPGKWTVGRTKVPDIDGVYEHNIIYSSNVHPDITAMDIKRFFSRYSLSKRKGTRIERGQQIEDTYPIVSMRYNKVTSKTSVMVTFDPSTREAQFALKVTRVSKIKAAGREHVVIFDKFKINKSPEKK